MIRGLHIENIAVVKKLDIDLCGGLNVLTGETGAGKSIIIDSLNLLLGSRADRELIRRGEDTALVSAFFEDIGNSTEKLLSEMGFECEDGCVMISRTVTAEGRSVARINGRSVTLSVMKEIASSLFNIHGQNDNQQLLDSKNHIRILDRFSGNGELLKKYSNDRGRKSSDPYLNYIINGTYNYITHFLKSDNKVTVEQSEFLQEYLIIIGRVKKGDALSDLNNLQSTIAGFLKSKLTPVAKHIKETDIT